MKILFMGTSEFAVPSLEKLIENDCSIVGVITQPDRPRGRGKKVSFTPIKELAIEKKLPVYQPKKIKDPETINYILDMDPDLIIVVSYGQIIPVEILDYPRYGSVNLHASLLPEYRGAAPIQRAIMDGKRISGITTMFMDEGLDTGDIIMQIPIPIAGDINHGDYESLLAVEGAELLLDTVSAIQSGSMPRKKQDDSRATYAPMITREDEKINWHKTAQGIHSKIRGLSPKPGAYTSINGIKVKIFKSSVVEGNKVGEIGEVVAINQDSFTIQTEKGLLVVGEVQRAGRQRMSVGDFLKGFTLNKGDLLDS
ncbi:MAG TPA: methionyl-tRNA formyltransferase [Syntrophomonadaceae bacterium]|nr:methionyl-tRNA formyltransferase [Syntrophomonadaceae bacterium]